MTVVEAWSGTLRLNDRNRHTRGDTRCPLCNHEYEDIEHFLLICDSLKSTRMKIVGLQCPHYEDYEDHEITIAQFLQFNESNEECITRNKDDRWSTEIMESQICNHEYNNRIAEYKMKKKENKYKKGIYSPQSTVSTIQPYVKG